MSAPQKPTKGLIAFEFISPNGIPDGDELHVQTTGALVLHFEKDHLWSIIGSAEAEQIAIEILKAKGKWPK